LAMDRIGHRRIEAVNEMLAGQFPESKQKAAKSS
jgi:hypothetical protein